MDDRQIREALHVMIIIFALFAMLSLFLCGCSHKVYVPVESVRTDTLYLSHRDSIHVKDSLVMHHVINTRDSVAIHDSVVIVKNEQGEVKERLIVRYRDRWHATQDNLSLQRQLGRYRLEIDSLREANSKIQYKIVPVEKKLSRWEKLKMDVGGWAIGAISTVLLGVVGYIVVWLLKKYRKI